MTAAPYDNETSWRSGLRRLLSHMMMRNALDRRQHHLLGPDLSRFLTAVSDDDAARYFTSIAESQVSARDLDGAIAKLAREHQARTLATRDAGVELRADELGGRFALDDNALFLVSAVATCQEDPVLRELLAMLVGARWRPWSVVGPLSELLAVRPRDRHALVEALGTDQPLMRYGLLIPGPAPEGWSDRDNVPLVWQTILASQEVCDFLAGRRVGLDPWLARLAEPLYRTRSLAMVRMPPSLSERLENVLSDFDAVGQAPQIWVRGERGTGIRELATALAASLAEQVLVVELDELSLTDARSLTRLDQVLLRHLILVRGAVVFDLRRVEEVLVRESSPELMRFLRRIAQEASKFELPIVVLTRKEVSTITMSMPELEPVQCGYLPPEHRAEVWTTSLAQEGLEVDLEDMGRVVDAYQLGEEDIARICRTVRRANHETVTAVHVEDACRDDLDLRLAGLTRRVNKTWTLDDIIVISDQKEALSEIVDYVQYRDVLLDKWGFSSHFSTGRGANCLFTGPPGTGKSMAASIIANELDLPLYRIELSQVVDRYVGETEKRLAQIFDEASRCPCALLFDEADSLFAKRTEVRSSNDRYANLEVNYLLQRMEEFDGISMLTTNLEASMDEAMVRRIRFRVPFPEPEERLRLQLWGALIPANAKLARDVHLDELAERYEMSGGHIKNAILRAAMKAVREKRRISMADFEEAARQEYSNMGRLAMM